MKMEEFDRRFRKPMFYIISICLMLAGEVLDWNIWLLGGGLAIFLIILFEDAKERGMIKPKRTKCDRCVHTFEERGENAKN